MRRRRNCSVKSVKSVSRSNAIGRSRRRRIEQRGRWRKGSVNWNALRDKRSEIVERGSARPRPMKWRRRNALIRGNADRGVSLARVVLVVGHPRRRRRAASGVPGVRRRRRRVSRGRGQTAMLLVIQPHTLSLLLLSLRVPMQPPPQSLMLRRLPLPGA